MSTLNKEELADTKWISSSLDNGMYSNRHSPLEESVTGVTPKAVRIFAFAFAFCMRPLTNSPKAVRTASQHINAERFDAGCILSVTVR